MTVLTLTLSLFLNACGYVFSSLPDPSLCKAWWTGEINDEFVEQARADFERVQANGCEKVTIALNSPGGYVVAGLETIRLMREAQAGGLIVEVYGGALVASMAVVVMAAGSPGHRIANDHTLVIVHGPRQRETPFEPMRCLGLVPNPTGENDKILNQIIATMTAVLVETTGRPWAEVSTWFACGQEQVGDGSLLVSLGIADALQS